VASRRLPELGAVIVLVGITSVPASFMVSGPRSPVTDPLRSSAVLALGHIFTMYIASLLLGYMSVLREAEKGTLDGIRTSPVQPEVLFAAKLTYMYSVLLVFSLTYTLVTALLSGLYTLLRAEYIAAQLVVAALFSTASALSSYIAIYSEAKSMLSGIVLAALVLPAMQQSSISLAEAAMGLDVAGNLLGLSGVALAFAAVAISLSRALLQA
jgi:heme exporter protein B